jgi:amidase
MLAGHANVAAYQEATPVQTQRIGSFDLLDVTIAELRTALDAGDITVRELVQACLDQIAALDQSGPALNAILELSDRALDDADALDAELADTGARGPLHGIPVILKDNIATTDGMENTAGSLALEGALPTQEAFVVGRLRDSGAVILGKAGLSEWANIRSPRSTSGWSGRGGQVLNPHQTDRSPSGSSSGSAVARSYRPPTSMESSRSSQRSVSPVAWG